MDQDAFDQLTGDEQDDLFVLFLTDNPDHPENVDNGQDFYAILYNDAEFIAWLKNKQNI